MKRRSFAIIGFAAIVSIAATGLSAAGHSPAARQNALLTAVPTNRSNAYSNSANPAISLAPNTTPANPLAAGLTGTVNTRRIFSEAPQYSAIGTATSIASGDFNGDGFPDLAVVPGGEQGGYQVAVLINRGDGSFEPPVIYTTADGTSGIAVGDFNNDGKLDLAVITYGYEGGSLSILLGNGDGTFKPQRSFFTEQLTSRIAVGDFNHDGNLDVVTLSTQADDVAVLLGNGDGTFQTPVVFPAGDDPYDLIVGDFNNDGNLDILASNIGIHQTGVSVLPGNGDGTFQSPVTTSTFSAAGLVSADFNHDGNLDIALIYGPSNQGGVTVWFGLGNGTFSGAVSYPTGNSPNFLAVADFNGDGNLDIAADGGANSVSVIFGKADGTFKGPIHNYNLGAGYGGIIAGDFNGDGKADIITTDPVAGAVDVLLGNGRGSFASRHDLATTGPTSVVVGDFNGDGIPDLASAGVENLVSVYFGKGDAKFGDAHLSAVGKSPAAIAAADFNGDGKLDLAVANGDDTVSILLNSGGGSFLPQVTYAAGGLPAAIAIGDFNRDGKPDIAVVNAACYLNADSCSSTGSLSILLNNGDGTFAPQVQYSLGYLPNSVVVGDFNGDGKPDLAVAVMCGTSPYCVGGGFISVLLGNGDGTFATPINFSPAEEYPAALAVADFNGDGYLDLAAADYFHGEVGILLNDGTGRFKVASEYIAAGQLQGFPQAVLAGDFNGDGRPDIALANNCAMNANFDGCEGTDLGTVGILLNVGIGHFEQARPYQYQAGTNPVALAAGDFNGDGKIDVVTANSLGSSLSILLNTSAGASQPGDYIPRRQ